MRYLLLFFTCFVFQTASAQPRNLANGPQPCTKLYPNVQDAYRVRLDMLASAKHEIQISYYHFGSNSKTYYLLALLEELRSRGVKVRIIMDGMNADVNHNTLKYLEHMGVEVKLFNRVKLKNLIRLDRRMHDKLLIIDRKYLLVGGRNISNKYFEGNLEAHNTFYDIDGFFEGKPAIQAAKYFDDRWNSKWVEKAAVKEKKLGAEVYSDLEVQTLQQLNIIRSDTIKKNLQNYLSAPCNDAYFVSNDAFSKKRNKPVEHEYIKLMNSAKHEIKIQNAYILYSRFMRRAIKKALARNVKITIIANSLQSIDIPISYAAYLNVRNRYLRRGVEFYEFLHHQTMHSKIAVIDSSSAVIGSFNLDPRSAFRNSETVVVVTDHEGINQIEDYFNRSLELSTPILKKRKPKGYEHRYPNTSKGRRLQTGLLRYTVAPIIRSFL